ncbi:AsmA family protein [Fodinibius sp.]|uniref:DUF748 domain-containing protein n=1 Tax=Fodinibius sp. TaxID=1872440 RepID=UPI002ACE87A5|nr:AsmA family protein [Fodinibius sp.]MDZ7659088.1 AsmA family protein [Fodinibius sp.]
MSLFKSKLDLKPVFQVLFAIIIVGATGALILSLSIDSMVQSSLESTTAEVLNTSVDVEDVSISLLNGSGTIKGFTIHNPEGFSDKPAAKLQEISIKLKVSSLLSNTVIVKEIRVQKPELYYEQKATGNNLDALTGNMGESSPSDTNLIVEYLLVENGQVTLAADIGSEKSVKAEFSKIEMEGIGRSGNNTMEQTIQQILKPVLEKALQEAASQGLMDKAKDTLQDMLDG